MTKIRVLVVEDSLTVRRRLCDVLNADAGCEVVGEAADGREAVELCEQLRPDVISLDMMLPVMTGLRATEDIMANTPTPILIVSASTNRGDLLKTYDALAAGAVDVIEKPADGAMLREWEGRFLGAIKLVASVKVITHPRARLRKMARPSAPAGLATDRSSSASYVALGVSTGGPQALSNLLGALPSSFPLPILIVMHMNPTLGVSFAEWLGTRSALPVATATDGEPLPTTGRPKVLLAPPDRHLVVRAGRMRLTDDSEVHSCRPSVDVLFESIAGELGRQTIAGLLTGMGRDGARGLLAIRMAGGVTFAQDEESSVVFGMPREAIALGAAVHVLPLGDMARFLVAQAEMSGLVR